VRGWGCGDGAIGVLGKKRILLILGVLAAIGTLLCCLTSNWALFLVGRGITGVSLGIAVLNLALIADGSRRPL
jgi:predicted MFS family arabinose efflux permease